MEQSYSMKHNGLSRKGRKDQSVRRHREIKEGLFFCSVSELSHFSHCKSFVPTFFLCWLQSHNTARARLYCVSDWFCSLIAPSRKQEAREGGREGRI